MAILRLLVITTLTLITLFTACGNEDNENPEFVIGGIPDQDVSTLERQFGLMADYLKQETGLRVRYVPSIDYAVIVTAFGRGDIQLAWLGGLTGVQARSMNPASQAIAQRPRDAEFHSVFIVRTDLAVEQLSDLVGLRFTFGSESSTSGHLMPRFFLQNLGINPDSEFRGNPGYSGSHDKTWKLVEAGAFDAGALNEAVWISTVAAGKVDINKVRAFYRTPSYFDYNWSIAGDIDATYGKGTQSAITTALLRLSLDLGKNEAELLNLFQTDKFIKTENSNYDVIREVAENIGIIRGKSQ
jgi:phosphonate transport system substrate-binding protein